MSRITAAYDCVYFYGSNSPDNVSFPKTLVARSDKENYPSFFSRRYFPFRSGDSKGKYIFHSSYYRYSSSKDAINVCTVHDFTYEYYSSGLPRIIHSFQKKLAVSKAEAVICVSHNTKKDLMRFYPFVPEDKIHVVYNGVGEEFQQLSSQDLEKYDVIFERPYLLYVGDRSSYKNFSLFMQTVDLLEQYSAVVVGGKPFDIHEQSWSDRNYGRVKHLLGLDTASLNAVYNRAHCLIYPSSYEGFGIPVLESMRAGCPVIAVNCSSIPEVAGNAAILLDQPDVLKVKQSVLMLEDRSLRNSLVADGLVNAERFSWDDCFSNTVNVYESLWKNSLEFKDED